MEFDRTLRAAQGYLELEMAAEAAAELDRLPPEAEGRPEVLRLRIGLALQEHAWDRGLELSRRLCLAEPRRALGFIHAAFCLHELGRTAEAKQLLEEGPQSLQANAIYHYNLGCYHARLGELDAAQECVAKALEMDPTLRESARYDSDLESLRCQL